jgi:hypothetical protein
MKAFVAGFVLWALGAGGPSFAQARVEPLSVTTIASSDLVPAESGDEREKRALAVAKRYLVGIAAYDEDLPRFVRGNYAENVVYFGKVRALSDVLRDKKAYAERWPLRSYAWRKDTLSVSCATGDATCSVRGLIDWATANLEKGRFSGGVASVQLLVSLGGDREVISEESSSVVERKRTVEPWKRIGHCERTTISEVGHRLGLPGSGSMVAFANGVYQVAYEEVPAVHLSRIGDPVSLCVSDSEKWCPVGATPTSTYRVSNRRSGGSWEMHDSTKSCWHSFGYTRLD